MKTTIKTSYYPMNINTCQIGNKSASIIEYNDYIMLRSYSTIVAMINRKTHKIYIRGYYSPTTSRHLNFFLEKYGYNPIYKKDYGKYKYNYWKKIVSIVNKNFSTYAN